MVMCMYYVLEGELVILGKDIDEIIVSLGFRVFVRSMVGEERLGWSWDFFLWFRVYLNLFV